MVLSREEFQFCEENESEKIKSLFQLRQSTNSFLVQCLADREIQKIQHSQDKGTSKAYRYNCAVVHCPHSFSQFSAVRGHGWDSFYDRTIDPKLRLGKVLHGNKNRDIHDVSGRVSGSNNLQETIDILREENSNLKKIYAEQLGKYAELQRNRPELVSADPTIREVQARNNSLVQQIQSKNVQISNLSAQVNNMRSQINRLANERNGNSISGQTVNQTLVMELLDQNESYKTLIASKDDEIRNLMAQVNALRLQNSHLGSSSGNNRQSTARETSLSSFDSKSCCIIM